MRPFCQTKALLPIVIALGSLLAGRDLNLDSPAKTSTGIWRNYHE
jgi:hypothetical protein